MLFMFIFLALIAIIPASGDRLIKFVANKRLERRFASASEYTMFEKWFIERDKLEIVKNNPGIIKVEPNLHGNGDDYIAQLAPLTFPGLRIASTVVFEIEKANESVTVACSEGSLKQSFEGSAFFSNLVSKLVPTVISSNSCGLDPESLSLFNDASLTIQFQIAPWFPVNGDMLEKGGSAAISSGIEKDLNKFLDNVLEQFRCRHIV